MQCVQCRAAHSASPYQPMIMKHVTNGALVNSVSHGCLKVKECHLRHIPHLPANIPMYHLLTLFRAGRSHMAVLCEPKGSYDSSVSSHERGEPLGIITLEDVTEEVRCVSCFLVTVPASKCVSATQCFLSLSIVFLQLWVCRLFNMGCCSGSSYPLLVAHLSSIGPQLKSKCMQ